jgi:hypothetical protein
MLNIDAQNLSHISVQKQDLSQIGDEKDIFEQLKTPQAPNEGKDEFQFKEPLQILEEKSQEEGHSNGMMIEGSNENVAVEDNKSEENKPRVP